MCTGRGYTAQMRLDARNFHDPDPGPLRDHSGLHPDIVERLVGCDIFPQWLEDARDNISIAIQRARDTTARLVTILVYCNAGRHRSVAAAEVIKHSVETVEGLRTLPTVHLSARFNRGHCACRACSPGQHGFHDARRVLALQQGATVCATVTQGRLPDELPCVIL